MGFGQWSTGSTLSRILSDCRRCHVATVSYSLTLCSWLGGPLVQSSLNATAKKARGLREQLPFACLLSVIHWRARVKKKSLFFVKETHGKSWSLWQCLFASLSLWLHCLLLSCRPARKGLISSQQWKESGIMLQAATTKSKAWSSETTGRNKVTV